MAAANILSRATENVRRFVAGSPRLKMAIFIVIGTVTGLYIIAAMVVLNLDAEVVRDKLVQSARTQGVELAIGDLGFSFPFVVTMNHVRLQDRAGGTVFELDRLRVTVSVWRFLILQPSFHFKASSGNGQLKLTVAPSLLSADVALSVDAAAFPIDHAAVKIGGNPLPFAGKLDGGAMFVLHPLAPSALDGNADFRLNGLSVNSGGQWGAFLAGFTPTEARCIITAGAKRLATKECSIITNMGNMELRAGATLKDNIGSSPLEGAVVFSPKGSLSSALDALYGKRRKADGKYYFPMGGTLGSPSLSP